MRLIRPLAALCLCLCVFASHAQQEPGDQKGMFCVGVSMSDYTVLSHSKYSTASNTNFGLQLSFWKPLVPHLDVSTNLGINLSKFPAGFIKSDSLGHKDATMHAEILIHFKAFAPNAGVNPFITAGIGGGTFGYQTAAYVPVGAGLAFHFNGGSILILQGQMREVLSKGITNNFMFFSAGFAHDIGGRTPKIHKSHRDEVVKDALSSAATKKRKRATPTNDVDTLMVKNSKEKSPLTDSDGDGIPDKDDKCPGIKGSRENMGCPFPPVEGADVVAMSADSVTYCIYFAYDQSELVGYDFAVLNRIMQILQSDKTLTIHISGHADTQGTGIKNMPISAGRAKVTVDYFTSYGIAASRITSSYYGSSRPLDNAQQWRNRRAEITIIKH
jgi:OmpA-OmpF porin, OOP family